MVVRNPKIRPGKEVALVNATMTIEDFNALMTSEQDDNLLLKILRKLTAVQKPEDVRTLNAASQWAWMGWS